MLQHECKSLRREQIDFANRNNSLYESLEKAHAKTSAAWAEMEKRQANLRRYLQSLRDHLKHSLLQREGPKSIGSIVDTEFAQWWTRWEEEGGEGLTQDDKLTR